MSFDDYVDLQGKIGSWAGAFEVEVLASALRYFGFVTMTMHFFSTMKGRDLQLFCSMVTSITKMWKGLMKMCWQEGASILQKIHRMPSAAVGHLQWQAFVRLNDFATEVGTSKTVGAATSCKSQRSCRLTGFASVRAARSSNRVAAVPQHAHKEDFHTWACDKCKTVLQAASML